MKDWKTIAKAALPDVPPEELDRIVEPLAALEAAFEPLVQDLRPEVEPATGLSLERESK